MTAAWRHWFDNKKNTYTQNQKQTGEISWTNYEGGGLRKLNSDRPYQGQDRERKGKTAGNLPDKLVWMHDGTVRETWKREKCC